MKRTLIILCMAFALAACNGDKRAEVPTVANEWIGHWQGVEGTALDIGAKDADGKYPISITDLDGPKQFQADAAKNGLDFSRNHVREIIRATDGKGTGMKWLTNKTNCLVIRKYSEGYCRP